jgi:biopolymer transport protein ExbD
MASALDKVSEEMQMNMTPMIDVVFLLIIFFLCIDFKILESKLPAYLPKDKGTATTQLEPIEQLPVLIVCDEWGVEEPRKRNAPPINPETGTTNAFVVQGHKIHWEVGPKQFDDIEDLKVELERIYKDTSTWHPDKDTGDLKPMPVTVEPGPRVAYGDVAETLDAITAANFEEVNFGSGAK